MYYLAADFIASASNRDLRTACAFAFVDNVAQSKFGVRDAAIAAGFVSVDPNAARGTISPWISEWNKEVKNANLTGLDHRSRHVESATPQMPQSNQVYVCDMAGPHRVCSARASGGGGRVHWMNLTNPSMAPIGALGGRFSVPIGQVV